MEDLWNPKFIELLAPDRETLRALFSKGDLPITDSHCHQQAIIAPVKEGFSWATISLTLQQRQEIETVEVILVRLTVYRNAGFQLFSDSVSTCRRHECRHPVLVRHDLVDHLPFRDATGPANHRGDAETAFPVSIFLASKRRNCRIRPGVEVRAVVSRVHNDGVIGHTELVQVIEHFTHHHVMTHHGIVIEALSGQTALIIRGMRIEVHPRGIHPNKEWLALLNRSRHEVLCR